MKKFLFLLGLLIVGGSFKAAAAAATPTIECPPGLDLSDKKFNLKVGLKIKDAPGDPHTVIYTAIFTGNIFINGVAQKAAGELDLKRPKKATSEEQVEQKRGIINLIKNYVDNTSTLHSLRPDDNVQSIGPSGKGVCSYQAGVGKDGKQVKITLSTDFGAVNHKTEEVRCPDRTDITVMKSEPTDLAYIEAVPRCTGPEMTPAICDLLKVRMYTGRSELIPSGSGLFEFKPKTEPLHMDIQGDSGPMTPAEAQQEAKQLTKLVGHKVLPDPHNTGKFVSVGLNVPIDGTAPNILHPDVPNLSLVGSDSDHWIHDPEPTPGYPTGRHGTLYPDDPAHNIVHDDPVHVDQKYPPMRYRELKRDGSAVVDTYQFKGQSGTVRFESSPIQTTAADEVPIGNRGFGVDGENRAVSYEGDLVVQPLTDQQLILKRNGQAVAIPEGPIAPGDYDYSKIRCIYGPALIPGAEPKNQMGIILEGNLSQ